LDPTDRVSRVFLKETLGRFLPTGQVFEDARLAVEDHMDEPCSVRWFIDHES
jgi:hypothetical protein